MSRPSRKKVQMPRKKKNSGEAKGRMFSVNVCQNDTIKLRRPPLEGCWHTYEHVNGDIDIKWLPKIPKLAESKQAQ